MVRAAAEGTVLLDARLDRTGIVPKIKQKLCEARPGHYAVDLILGDMLLEHDYEVQGEKLEILATYRTAFGLGDVFTGFECELPWGEDDIPPGTTWVPAICQGTYQLVEDTDATPKSQ